MLILGCTIVVIHYSYSINLVEHFFIKIVIHLFADYCVNNERDEFFFLSRSSRF